MSFAPYSNNSLYNGGGEQVHPTLLGQFVEKSGGNWFEYSDRLTDYEWRAGWLADEYPNLVHVGSGSVAHARTCVARVLKTVAYVVVDEDENGPVVEKWFIKRHKQY